MCSCLAYKYIDTVLATGLYINASPYWSRQLPVSLKTGLEKRRLTRVQFGAVQTVTQSKQDLGELPFTGKTEQLFLVVFGHYNGMLTAN